jgi:hypothetical protein
MMERSIKCEFDVGQLAAKHSELAGHDLICLCEQGAPAVFAEDLDEFGA